MPQSNACCPAGCDPVAVAVAAAVIGVGDFAAPDQSAWASQSMITPATQIAGAGVLGNDRKRIGQCARAAARTIGPPARPALADEVASGDGITVERRAQRIVSALRYDQLDAPALGLSRTSPPRCQQLFKSTFYLGTTVHDLPGVGTRSAPTCAPLRQLTRI